MAFPTYTYTFTNGSTADATQVNQNFTDILNGVTDTTKDISVNAITAAGASTLNGNITLGNASSKTLTINAVLSSSLALGAQTTYDIGTATVGLRALYIGGTSTFTTKLTSAATASYTINLPTTVGTVNQLLQTDGSGNSTWTAPPILKKQIFTSTGANTFTIPTGTIAGTVFKFTVTAGGGGGGGGDASHGGGGGGGAGGTEIWWGSGFTAGNTITCTVGALGAKGGAATAGNAGADSTLTSGTQAITTVTAKAGAGGQSLGGVTAPTRGGLGGAAGTNGDLHMGGGSGGYGETFSPTNGMGGVGGASMWGGGGQGGDQNGGSVNGTAGVAYGSGGGGGGSVSGATNGTGGDAANGVIIIEFVL